MTENTSVQSASTSPGHASSPVQNGGSSALLTSLDQVLSSGSNALMVFSLARISSVEQFGVVALLVAGVAAVLGFNRGALGTPLLLTSNLQRHWVVAEARYASSWALGSGVLAAAAVATVGVAFGQSGIGLAFAACIPVVLVQDVLRFASIAVGQPMIAVRSDAFWAATMTVVFVVTLFESLGTSPLLVICAWGTGAVASTLFIAIPLQVTLPRERLGEWWRRYRRARLRFGALYTAIQASAFFVTLIVTVFIGSAAAAGVRGAAAIFGPIAMLVSALPLVFIPHARRTAGPAASQWRVLMLASIVSSGFTLLVTVMLVLTPSWLGSALLGDTWGLAHSLIPMIGVESAAMCWIVSVYSFFQAQGDSRRVVHLNVVQCLLQLTLCLGAALFVGTAAGIAAALAVSGLASTLIGVAFVVGPVRAGRSSAACGPKLSATSEVTAS